MSTIPHLTWKDYIVKWSNVVVLTCEQVSDSPRSYNKIEPYSQSFWFGNLVSSPRICISDSFQVILILQSCIGFQSLETNRSSSEKHSEVWSAHNKHSIPFCHWYILFPPYIFLLGKASLLPLVSLLGCFWDSWLAAFSGNLTNWLFPMNFFSSSSLYIYIFLLIWINKLKF